MTLDPEIERRLRKIAEPPQPGVPDSVYRSAVQATEKRGKGMRFTFGRPRGRFGAVPAIGVALAVVLAVSLAGLLLSVRSNVAGGPSPSATASAASRTAVTPTPSLAETTPAESPGPTMVGIGFTTPGATTGWTGFSWTKLTADSPMLENVGFNPSHGVAQVLRWKGGFVATESVAQSWITALRGVSHGLWTSPDGQTWTAVTSIDATDLIVSVAPFGLLAMAVDPETRYPTAAWTSTDGVGWHKAGSPNMTGYLISIAGTDSGIVATFASPLPDSGWSSERFKVEFSTDGLNWTPETAFDLTAGTEGAWGPHVQTNAGRFYLMGTPHPMADGSNTTTFGDEMWLSGDGRNWTRSSGGYSFAADFIDFGRDGMVLHTIANDISLPLAYGLAWSADGGMTWHDARNGPLGAVSCTDCVTSPDGLISANGNVFLAVKTDGKKAWLSYDGHTWTPIAWTGGFPALSYSLVVMPRGVILGDSYGAAK